MDGELFKSFSFAVFCGVYAFNAAVGASLFSDYGQIQNVQNYSTNPFWSPGSPYNQRVPQPVYVQGTDLKSGECMNVVKSAVTVQCMARDNCKNTSLSDIRPAIMVQLSNLPNKNYVSACAGYIDSVFESYVAQYGNSVANGGYVSFPDATTPANYSNNSTIQIQNPYKVQAPDWMVEINERKNELQQLQEQNGLGTEHLEATNFPSVYEDLSFTARIELQKEGYEPFKDKDSYIVPKFQNEGEWCNGDGKFTDFCRCRGDEKDSDYCKEYKEKLAKLNTPGGTKPGSGNGLGSRNGSGSGDGSSGNGSSVGKGLGSRSAPGWQGPKNKRLVPGSSGLQNFPNESKKQQNTVPPTNSEQPKTPTQKQTPPKQQQQPNNTVPPANSEQPQQKKEVVPPTHSEQPQVPEQTPTPTQQQQPNLDPARGLWGGTVEEDPYFGDEPLTREYDYWIRVLPDTPASCYQVCYPRDVETVNRNDFLNQGIFYPTLSAIFCVQNNNLLGTIDDPNDPHSSLGFVSDFESIKESKMPHQFSEAKIRKILAQLRDIDANNGLPTDCTKISLEFYQVDIAAQEIVTKQEISIPTKTRSISVR